MRKRVVILLLLLWPLAAGAHNALKGNDSPYLAMHGEDPVDWRPWSAAVLEEARRDNKLVFVSSGYFACHWCHVMQRESFQDPGIARLLNEHFIAVKVDRELHPALDAYLIDFVTRTRGVAGWPLNVFLTPDGHPLVGMVYLPAERFSTLLARLQDQWQNDPATLREAAASAAQQLSGQAVAPDPPLDLASVQFYEQTFLEQALQLGDMLSGGFGEQAKFPMAPQLLALLSTWERRPVPRLEELLLLSLDHMASQGLRDQLGGGFFRYTVDPAWQTPHFEKMLYDNALLAVVYLRAARLLKRPDYEAVGRETLDFMIRELSAPGGGMMASLSAVDQAGLEGGYYLWRDEILAKLLTKDELALVRRLWGLGGPAEFAAGNLARQSATLTEVAAGLDMPLARAGQLQAAARSKLLAARAKRDLPVDPKRLAAWNGLALSALVSAATLPGGERYRQAARQVRDYLVNELWDGERLWRARGAQGEIGQASLEDYAFAAQGLLDWAELTASRQDRLLARRWLADALRRFHLPGGWQLSDQTLLPAMQGRPLLDEGPLPSPAATWLRTALRLADDPLAQQARSALVAGHARLAREAFDYPSQLTLLQDFVAKASVRD